MYHAHDAAGQVTSILHVGPGGLLQSLYYAYDADGQRTRIIREDGTRIYYAYDGAHRLTGEDWLDPGNGHLYAFAYEYDAAGNRKRKTFNGEVTYYGYNNVNQLTKESVLGGGTTYYTWTADGEMATKRDPAGDWTYFTWDVDESLRLIEAPEVTLGNTYNARMQRVSRDEDGTASTLVYDVQKLVAEASEAGAVTRLYLSEGGSVYSPLVAQFGSEHWFLFDALGTTLGLTTDAGSLSDSFLYEAFGTSLGRTGATATPWQYVGGYGYYREPSVGLGQVWWRWLETAMGRWQSRDPVGRFGQPGIRSRVQPVFGLTSHDLYPYLASNPVLGTDPTGLADFWDWFMFIGCVGGAFAVCGMCAAFGFGACFAALAIACHAFVLAGPEAVVACIAAARQACAILGLGILVGCMALGVDYCWDRYIADPRDTVEASAPTPAHVPTGWVRAVAGGGRVGEEVEKHQRLGGVVRPPSGSSRLRARRGPGGGSPPLSQYIRRGPPVAASPGSDVGGARCSGGRTPPAPTADGSR